MSHLRKFQAFLKTKNGARSGSVATPLPFFLAAFILASGLAFSQSSHGDDKKALPKAINPADNAEANAALADEVELEPDEGLSVLVVPTRFTSKTKEADKLKFSQELRELLLEGFKEKGDSLETARKHFEAAHRLPVDDPRAAYSYAVVLLAQKKSIGALEQFRAAAKPKKVPFLPALQGFAWTNLSRADYAEALPALLDLASRLEESQESWPAPQDREQTAEWLGRAVGYLTGPGKAAAKSAPVKKLEDDVAKLLTAERKQAYERGKKEVAARYVELKAQAARPDAELLAEASRKREEMLAALAAAESDVKRIEDELRELKKPHDKLLLDLSREIRSNGTKIRVTSPKVDEAGLEVADLSAPKKHASIKTQTIRRSRQTQMQQQKVIRDENAGEKKLRESQLASAESKLGQLTSSLEQAKQAIADAKSKRDQEYVDYRRATAGKRQALQESQYKAAELAALARDAENGALTPEKMKARVTALEAYVPLYPELEKDRILASLKPPS